MKIKDFKNIIFDLGGVIMNIDPELTLREFARLSGKTIEEIKINIHKHRQAMEQYELGQIDDRAFKASLNQFSDHTVSDKDFEDAWNKVLIDIPPERIELLKRLKSDHYLILLSNTNHLHLKRFNEILANSTGIKAFSDLFDKVYYSFLMHMRKPNQDIYQQVLDENDLDPDQTLFLDDLDENLQGAAQLGIHTLKVKRNHLSLEMFS